MNTDDLVFFFSFVFSTSCVYCKVLHLLSPVSFSSQCYVANTTSPLVPISIYSTFVNGALLIFDSSFLADFLIFIMKDLTNVNIFSTQ